MMKRNVGLSGSIFRERKYWSACEVNQIEKEKIWWINNYVGNIGVMIQLILIIKLEIMMIYECTTTDIWDIGILSTIIVSKNWRMIYGRLIEL